MSRTLRFLIHLAFVYTCVEGFIVNLTYPSITAYLVKDLIILLAYLVALTELRPSVGSLRKIGAPILAFALVMMFFLLMPTRVSAVAALVALKQRLFYIPLLYLGYFYTRSERDAYGLIRLFAWTAIPIGLFGIYLFFEGPNALRDLGGTYSAIIYSTAGAAGVTFWRVPGTFTSPGQYSLYLMIHVTLFTGVLFVPNLQRRFKGVAIVALVVSLAALLASGTRTPLIVYVLCVGAALAYMGRLSRLGIAALGLYAILAIGFTYFGAGVQDRVGSVLSQENYERFRNTAFGQVFYSEMMSTPMGYGLGAATIAGRHFTDFTKLVFVESYFGIVAVETGIFGLLICIWLMGRLAMLIVSGRFLVKRALWSPLWIFLALLILEMIALMPSSAMIDSAPGNVYFWFLIGILVRLVDVEHGRLLSAHTPQPVRPAVLTPGYAFHALR